HRQASSEPRALSGTAGWSGSRVRPEPRLRLSRRLHDGQDPPRAGYPAALRAGRRPCPDLRVVSGRRSRSARDRLQRRGRAPGAPLDSMRSGRSPRTRSRRKRCGILVYAPEDAPRYAELIRAPRGVQVYVASNAGEAQPVLADVDVLYAWKFPSALFAKTERLAWLH